MESSVAQIHADVDGLIASLEGEKARDAAAASDWLSAVKPRPPAEAELGSFVAAWNAAVERESQRGTAGGDGPALDLRSSLMPDDGEWAEEPEQAASRPQGRRASADHETGDPALDAYRRPSPDDLPDDVIAGMSDEELAELFGGGPAGDTAQPGAVAPKKLTVHDDGDDAGTLSVDRVLSVPEDHFDEFLGLPSDAPPESVAGVLVSEPPGSLAALMEEIGVNDAPPSSSGWVEPESLDEPASAPPPPPPPLGGLPMRVPSIPPPLPKSPPKAAADPAAKPLPKAGSIGATERAPKSKRRSRLRADADAARRSPPRRAREAHIPAPPPADDEQLDREMMAAIARSSIYPLGEPPAETVLSTGDRGAETVSTELRGAVPSAVAAARAQAAMAERRFAMLVRAAVIVAVGIGGFALGRWTAAPGAGDCPQPSDGRLAAARDDGARDRPRPESRPGPGLAATQAPTTEPPPGATAPTPNPGGLSVPSPGSPFDPSAARTPGQPGEPTPAPTPTAATPTTAAPTAEATAAPAAAEFDKQAAAAALGGAAAAAAGCRSDGSTGTVAVPVAVTFAPSGRVTTVNIQGGPYAGTPTGSCIAQSFKQARVPPFTGGAVTVQKTVTLR